MALEAVGQLNTPMRRQLFGLEPMTGANGFKRLAQHNGSDEDNRMFKGASIDAQTADSLTDRPS